MLHSWNMEIKFLEVVQMRFRNLTNGYTEESRLCWLWCLIFGGFYFAYKGLWTHFFIGIFLAMFTCGLSWLIYPFFASTIVRTGYLRKGWVEISNDTLIK